MEDDTARALRSLCRQVAVVPIGRPRRAVQAAARLLVGRSATEGYFQSRELLRTVRAWAQTTRFDCVIAVCSSMVQYAHLPELTDTPLIVDLMDVDSQKWHDCADRSSGWRRSLFRLEASRVAKLECALLGHAQAVTLVSEAEAALFRRLHPNTCTHAVANGVDLSYFRPADLPSAVKSLECAFVGVLNYHANVDGLEWFCREVWPEVHRRLPQAEFLMIGRDPGAAVKRLTRVPGVKLVGEVPDVRPYLERATVIVAPLRIARGVQNKVLEAMAMGKAVIASRQALEGLNADKETQVVCAGTSPDWISQVLALCNDAPRRERLGCAARMFVERNHSWSACSAPLEKLLQPVATHVESSLR